MSLAVQAVGFWSPDEEDEVAGVGVTEEDVPASEDPLSAGEEEWSGLVVSQAAKRKLTDSNAIFRRDFFIVGSPNNNLIYHFSSQMHAKRCEEACIFDIKTYLISYLSNISYEDEEFEKAAIIFYVYALKSPKRIYL